MESEELEARTDFWSAVLRTPGRPKRAQLCDEREESHRVKNDKKRSAQDGGSRACRRNSGGHTDPQPRRGCRSARLSRRAPDLALEPWLQRSLRCGEIQEGSAVCHRLLQCVDLQRLARRLHAWRGVVCLAT